jgi:hypothetical protein
VTSWLAAGVRHVLAAGLCVVASGSPVEAQWAALLKPVGLVGYPSPTTLPHFSDPSAVARPTHDE